MKKADPYKRYLAGIICENQYLSEAMVEDESLKRLVLEYTALTEELERMKAELKDKEARSKELAGEIAPVIEALDETEQRTLQVDQIVVSIKQAGYTRQSYSYQKAYEDLLTRVDYELRAISERVKEATKTTTTVATTLKVQKLEHGFFSAMARIWGVVTDFIGLSNHKIDRALADFRSSMQGLNDV